MKKRENKKGRHSRVLLSGIFNACRAILSYEKQRNVEDPRLQTSGMTPCFMKSRAFTLIELLVVVLIIGILAAIALPQYQKAVYKAQYSKLKILAASVAEAQEVYYLANGGYASKLEELDIDMPGGKTNESTDSKYVYDWGLVQIDDPTGNAQVEAYNTMINMGYQQRLAHSKTRPNDRICYAGQTASLSDIRSQVCKAETGNEGTPNTTYKVVFFDY